MKTYLQRYKPIYEKMSAKEKLREISRIALRSEIKPLARLVAILIVSRT
jgi:hypothetical protein